MALHWIVLLVVAWLVVPLPLAVLVGRAFTGECRREQSAASAAVVEGMTVAPS